MSVYVQIRLLGAPLLLINYAILGYVLGRGEGSLALGLQLVLNLTNIFLSILFGLKLGWGVAGVAWGTVGGEFLAMLLGMGIVVRRFRRGARLPRAQLFDRQAFGRMISVNRDIMIRSFSLLAAFALFTRQGAQFGTVTLAANGILMNFFLVSAFFLDGFATAAEQLAGRAVGARNETAFRRTAYLTCLWGFALSAIATVALLVFGADLIAVVSNADSVQRNRRDLSALGGLYGDQRGSGLPDGWHLHRRDLVDGHAQHDASVAADLCRGDCHSHTVLWQSRPVVGPASVPDCSWVQPAGDTSAEAQDCILKRLNLTRR